MLDAGSVSGLYRPKHCLEKQVLSFHLTDEEIEAQRGACSRSHRQHTTGQGDRAGSIRCKVGACSFCPLCGPQLFPVDAPGAADGRAAGGHPAPLLELPPPLLHHEHCYLYPSPCPLPPPWPRQDHGLTTIAQSWETRAFLSYGHIATLPVGGREGPWGRSQYRPSPGIFLPLAAGPWWKTLGFSCRCPPSWTPTRPWA